MITTLAKTEGTKTENMTEIHQLMLGQLIAEDKLKESTPYYKTIREQSKHPVYTTHVMEFTNEEFRQVIEYLQPKNAPGPNGITKEIVKQVFKEISYTITEIYNACLRTKCFPDNWKVAKIFPIVKPRRERNREPSNFLPNNLLHTEGKNCRNF